MNQPKLLSVVVLAASVGACDAQLEVANADANAAIYGEDNRYELRDETRSPARVNGQSSVVIGTGLVAEPTGYRGQPSNFGLCADEKWSGQLSMHENQFFGSGVLIESDLIATANHVLEGESCSELLFVFDYALEANTNQANPFFPLDKVYRCAEIVGRDAANDVAVIRLDRAVTDRNPVTRASTFDMNVGDGIYAVGYPIALPAKVAPSSVVALPSGNLPDFATYLDAEPANSGSPVFNSATHELEGLLVATGQSFNGTTFVWDTDGSCYRRFTCLEAPDDPNNLDTCLPSAVTPIQAVDALIPAQ